MKITTWNVNSINVRLAHILSFLQKEKPDVIGLQELKAPNEKFPLVEIEAAGYYAAINGQPAYNGVALIANKPIENVILDIPGFEFEEKRVVAGTVAGVRIVNAYIPNGQNPDSDKYQYKLHWLKAFTAYIQTLIEDYSELIVMGDFNIAPTDDDVHNPLSWKDKILCTDQERVAFRQLLNLGLLDSLRIEAKPKGVFTWWDYRQESFEKNSGIRIDHLLLSNRLGRRYQTSMVHLDYRALDRPSDHAPVSVILK